MKKTICIVAGGNSIKDIDPSIFKKEFDYSIAVNKSVLTVPDPDYFVTMDYTFFNKLTKTEQIYSNGLTMSRVFIENFVTEFMKEEEGRIVDSRFNLVYNLEPFNIILKSRRSSPFGLNFLDFANGENSGFCALQMAICLGFEEIYLYGFDMNCEDITHFHGGYGESVESFQPKLDKYCDYFLKSIPRLPYHIKIYSCSKNSTLNRIIPYTEI